MEEESKIRQRWQTVAPAVLDAIAKANHGFATGYGDDDWTRSVERRLSEIFEREVAAFLVSTGTAANALALAQITPPWGVVLCHAESHVAPDECGAPEFFGGGLKPLGLPGDQGKLTADRVQKMHFQAAADIAPIRETRKRRVHDVSTQDHSFTPLSRSTAHFRDGTTVARCLLAAFEHAIVANDGSDAQTIVAENPLASC